MMKSDLDIARAAKLLPIAEVAARAGIPEDALEPFGRLKAKVSAEFVASLAGRPDGALVLVTGISPTAAGEGKTTTTVGLGDALNAAGAKTMICLREPSLGPSFGMKGGAAGGGYAQVVPMEDINLHFTGDFHAITSANNLLSALLDNHLYWGNALGIDPRKVSWRRALDMNDRALRRVMTGIAPELGDPSNGAPREDGFDITVASEVMAVFCLAADLADLQARLARMVVAERRDGSLVTAGDLQADGAMAVLLREALQPNLVQTIAGSPALVHGGPFANIAHGCNSVIATRLGLKLAEITVTEAGFGADLGAEKFFGIKSRSAGLSPSCAVLVATVRALKMHGGVAKAALGAEDLDAVRRGSANMVRHVENLRKFGVPAVIALNRFGADTEAELALVQAIAAEHGARAHVCTHWSDGAAGAAALAEDVRRIVASGDAGFRQLYADEATLADKLRTVAREIYRASDVAFAPAAAKRLAKLQDQGFGALPVCVAKTPYSFSDDASLLGAPEGHVLNVSEVRLSAGAGFVVALAGSIRTMPGLPRNPAAASIRVDADGLIQGLF
jgi:formate--tetrahydrofolate ligase